MPRVSAATRRGQRGLGYGVRLETLEPAVKSVFRSSNWKVVDSGGRLHRWQVDLYWGEDKPLGADRLMARPRGTEFEYAYSVVKRSEWEDCQLSTLTLNLTPSAPFLRLENQND